ncbi:MAG: hypothetical protein H0W95_01045 [Nocardioidaceae bacterium]|nr:hypothetical protein [Nocardioidaceae bacterium]
MASLVLLSAGVAAAESQTVEGTGDIDRMVASNGQNAVTAKVFGMAPPCDTHYLWVTVNWRGADLYRAEAGCYPGGIWAKGLYYHDSADDQNPDQVNCDGFVFRWDGERQLFKVVIPRSCLDNAPNRIRVAAEGHVYSSTTGSEAGPTRLLARG